LPFESKEFFGPCHGAARQQAKMAQFYEGTAN